jgi:hypothetical protein
MIKGAMTAPGLLGIFLSLFLSAASLAAEIDQAALKVCFPENCIAVEADKAYESGIDQTLVFISSDVSYFTPDAKHLIKKITNAEVTWKPEMGLLWIQPEKGLSLFYDLKEQK